MSKKKQVYGLNGLISIPENVTVTSSKPTSSTRGELGSFILDKPTGNLYYLSSISGSTYKWTRYGDFDSSIKVKAGAATDYAGTGTLVAGVCQVLNTDIKSTDLVFIQRIDAGTSTAIGHLSYAIVENTSLTITSLDATASTETDDVSEIAYFIIKTI